VGKPGLKGGDAEEGMDGYQKRSSFTDLWKGEGGNPGVDFRNDKKKKGRKIIRH